MGERMTEASTTIIMSHSRSLAALVTMKMPKRYIIPRNPNTPSILFCYVFFSVLNIYIFRTIRKNACQIVWFGWYVAIQFNGAYMVNWPIHFKLYCASIIKRFQLQIILFSSLIIYNYKVEYMTVS